MLTVLALSGERGLVRLLAATRGLLVTTLPGQVKHFRKSQYLFVSNYIENVLYYPSGNYLYVEASSPAQEGNKAWLLSDQFLATAGRCLSFWYHMYGASIGTLNVYIVDIDDQSTLVWSRSGDQGNQWNEAKLMLESELDYKVG